MGPPIQKGKSLLTVFRIKNSGHSNLMMKIRQEPTSISKSWLSRSKPSKSKATLLDFGVFIIQSTFSIVFYLKLPTNILYKKMKLKQPHN